MTSIDDAAIVSAVSDAVSCEFGDGVALLDLDEYQYYGLNEVGAFVWQLLQTPIAFADVCDATTGEFDVNENDCRPDLERLLTEMQSAGLIRIEHVAVG